MKILVTGSEGFVGKQLVSELKKKGHKVDGFDSALGNDILDLAQLKKVAKGKNAVFHLAAVLDETKPKQMLEVNVKGTENVVDASAKAGVEQLIYLSTVGVHARVKGLVDEHSAIEPETMYETTKARGEKIVWESQEMLPITILRSALVLGPNRYWKGIAKLAKKKFPLIGSGKNLFQTIYVKDLVSALLFVLGKSECSGETYIVAGKEKPTLKELYGLIKKELGFKGEVETIPVWLGKILSYIYLAVSKVTGKKTVVLPQHIQRLVRERNYSTVKISKLGWKPMFELKKAVFETVAGLEK